MTDHLKLIRSKLQHLLRMREYLAYSLGQVESVLLLKDWKALSPDQHESLAASKRIAQPPTAFDARQLYHTRAHTSSMSIPSSKATVEPGLTGQHIAVRPHTEGTVARQISFQ